jgi:hypothetical protein
LLGSRELLRPLRHSIPGGRPQSCPASSGEMTAAENSGLYYVPCVFCLGGFLFLELRAFACVYMCVHLCVHVHTCAYMCVHRCIVCCVHAHMHVSIPLCACVCLRCVHGYMCVCTCMLGCANVYYVSMYMHVCIGVLHSCICSHVGMCV